MNRDYCYGDKNADKPLPHLWRVFEATYDKETQTITGDCAWSVYSCMFDGPHTYQGDHKDDPKYNGTTIVALSKELNLKIEIYSEESGMGFQEHYLIDKGKLLIDDCRNCDWEENEDGEYEPVGGFPNYCEFVF